MNRHVVPSKSLIGEAVHSRDPRIDGQIEDVLLDAENGRIAYALIAFTGLDVGERLIAVPWEAIRMDLAQGGDGLILDADRKQLQSAPFFNRENLPNFADPQFAIGIYRHYGIHPYWESAPASLQ